MHHWCFYVCLGKSGKLEGHSKCASIKMCCTPWKPQGEKTIALNYVAFLLTTLIDSTLFLE